VADTNFLSVNNALRLDTVLVVWTNAAARRATWLRLGVSGLARWLAHVEIGLMLLQALSGRRGSAGRMFLAVGITYLACDLLGVLWSRGRPFARLRQVEPLVEHDVARSFPSRHVASGLAMAAIGARAHPRLGATMTLVAWLLGLSRVAAGVHYPSDVLAGAALGQLIGWCFVRKA
jgi:membrane-associated phospholipid phosphatase